MSSAIKISRNRRVTKLPKTWVKTMIDLTCAGMVGMALLEQYFPQEEPGMYRIRRLCQRTVPQAQEASRCWGTVRDKRTLDLLGLEVLAFRKKHVGDSVHCTELTSIALELLNDLYEHVDNNEKREAVGKLMDTVRQIHEYLEVNTKPGHDYFTSAGRKIDSWKEAMA